MRLRLDVETFSELDIKKVGSSKYARHESTEVLMAAYWIDDERYFWDATLAGIPNMLAQAFEYPESIIYAFNAQFERLILKHVLGYDIPASRFRCTMVRAYELSFKGSLHQVGEQMGIDPSLLKYATEGRKLINKFCKPAPANHKADRYDRKNHPEKWEEFCGYCRQDVVAEAAIDEFCDQYYPTSEFEQQLYILDQKINDRGVPVDRQMIDAAIQIAKQVKAKLLGELKALTGLVNSNSNAQLIPWLLDAGVDVPKKWSTAKKEMSYTLDKEAVAALSTSGLTGPVLVALDIKAQISKTSVSKYAAFAKAEDAGIVRGMFQLNGASRTGRWCLAGDTNLTVKRDNVICKIKMININANDLVWDGQEFVRHGGLIFSGYQETISYDGITGTAEHVVFTECGKEVCLSEAREKGYRLKVAKVPPENNLDFTLVRSGRGGN